MVWFSILAITLVANYLPSEPDVLRFFRNQKEHKDGVIVWTRPTQAGSFGESAGALSGFASGEAASPFGQSVAVLVGVGRYANLTRLKAVNADLLYMSRFLAVGGGFDKI